jgi:hypothetical protein
MKICALQETNIPKLRSKSVCRRFIITIIDALDIIRRLVSYKPAYWDPNDRASPSLRT